MYPIKNGYKRSLKLFFKACAHDRYSSRDFIVGFLSGLLWELRKSFAKTMGGGEKSAAGHACEKVQVILGETRLAN